MYTVTVMKEMLNYYTNQEVKKNNSLKYIKNSLDCLNKKDHVKSVQRYTKQLFISFGNRC